MVEGDKYVMLHIIILLLVAGNVYAWDHQYKKYDTFLHTYVKDGLVNYGKIIEHADELEVVQSEFELLGQQEWDTFTLDEQLVFWINTYNFYTVKLIVDNYPLASIKDLSRPWKQKFFTLLGEHMSLNTIEHTIIRKKYKEPRIHFALVCAAVSCPILQDWAYTADNLQSKLDDVGRIFLNDISRNNIRVRDGSIYISKIFKWYGDDFTKDSLTYRDEISRITDVVYDKELKIRFMDYNWSLNVQSNK